MKRQVILDTETTGLLTSAGHRLIEIGCVEMINRRYTGKRFHTYINPQRPVDPEAFAVHGLSNEFLKDKPFFAQIVHELLAFLSGAELIIHNAEFDVGFLNHELKLWDKNAKSILESCSVIDTLILARAKHPGQSNNLDALCRRYQIDNSKRDLHGALIDAYLLGEVYRAMTGGQDQLFVADDKTNQNISHVQDKSEALISKNRHPLKVLQPTAEELSSHQEFLDFLQKNGKCVWTV